MTEEKNLSYYVSKELFSKKFSLALDLWKKEDKGNTQKSFAELARIGENTITDYKKGKYVPREDAFQQMLEVFSEVKSVKVDREFFLPQTDDEEYRYSPERAAKVYEEQKAACEMIGLDPGFLSWVLSDPDFVDRFPFYTPIKQECNIPHRPQSRRYTREEISEIAEDDNPFQYEANGKRQTLSYGDLEFLKATQDFLNDLKRMFYLQRTDDMKFQVKEVNAALEEKMKTGSTFLTDEEVSKIDRYDGYNLRRKLYGNKLEGKIGSDPIPISEFWKWWNKK